MFASHKQLHMFGICNIVNVLVSAPGPALHLWCEALTDMSPVKHKSGEKSSETRRSKTQWHVCVCFSHLPFLALSIGLGSGLVMFDFQTQSTI